MAAPVRSDLDFGSAARITGLPDAVSVGQPLVWGQSLLAGAYSGGLYAESRANNTTSTSQVGVAVTLTGTTSTPNLAATNQRASTRRSIFTSAATAGALAGLRCNHLMCWRGNAAGLGGFRLQYRFALETLVSGNRGFVGLWDSTSAHTNVDPLSSTAGNKIGMAFNSDTGNWQLIHNAAGTAPTVIDLGSNLSLNTNDVPYLELKCAENSSTVDWAVAKGGSSTVIASGTISTNLPANNVFLAPQIWICNNAQAAACAIAQVAWRLSSKNGG